MPRVLSETDEDRLLRVLERLQRARARWCAEAVDDPEEMWMDIPEMLDVVVPEMESVLKKTASSTETS
jgi:hypothetical protein